MTAHESCLKHNFVTPLIAISIVSLQWYTVKDAASIITNLKKLLVALTFFLSSLKVNESFVQWSVGMIGSSKLERNLVCWEL